MPRSLLIKIRTLIRPQTTRISPPRKRSRKRPKRLMTLRPNLLPLRISKMRSLRPRMDLSPTWPLDLVLMTTIESRKRADLCVEEIVS